MLAQQRGYYKDTVLDLTIDTGNGSTAAISLVSGGAYDVASADLSSMIEFNTANPSSKLVAVAIQCDLNPNAVMERKDGPIKKPSDLAGRTLLSQPSNASRKLFRIFAKAQGFDPASVKRENVTPDIGDTRFVKGDFDGVAYFYFTGLLNLKSRGMMPEQPTMFRFSDLGMRSYGNGLVANPKSLSESPDAIRAFVKASTRGWIEALADPKAGGAAIKARKPLAPEAIEMERLQLIASGSMRTPDTLANG